MEDRIATIATTVKSSNIEIPRIRRALGTPPLSVSILLAPECLKATIEVFAHTEDFSTRAARDLLRLTGRSRRRAGTRLGCRKQQRHARCDAALCQLFITIRDRQIVLIVQVGNGAAIE